jgi:methyl-accepting chemotaxis protein
MSTSIGHGTQQNVTLVEHSGAAVNAIHEQAQHQRRVVNHSFRETELLSEKTSTATAAIERRPEATVTSGTMQLIGKLSIPSAPSASLV